MDELTQRVHSLQYLPPLVAFGFRVRPHSQFIYGINIVVSGADRTIGEWKDR